MVPLALTGTINCRALIHSPCRSDRYKKQRRRLYHQDSCDAIPVDQLLRLGLSGTAKTPSRLGEYSHCFIEVKIIFLQFRLGSGSFGSVFFGKYDNRKVAIKQFYRTPSFSDKSFSAELNAFRLDHPNIVKILTFTCQDNHTQVFSILFCFLQTIIFTTIKYCRLFLNMWAARISSSFWTTRQS